MTTTAEGWLPNLPQHWKRKRLKFLFRFASGGTPTKDRADFWVGDIPWVSPKDMKSELILQTEDTISEAAVRESATTLVPAGTLLIVTRSGILRHTIPVSLTGRDVTINQDLKALLPRREEVEPRFYAAFIRGLQSQLLTLWRKQGATVESLETDLIGETEVPLPPLDEQKLIVKYIERETKRINNLIEQLVGPNWQLTIDSREVGGMVGLLLERRTALISAAVTGDLNVAREFPLEAAE